MVPIRYMAVAALVAIGGLGTAAEAWTASSGGAGAVTRARLAAGPREASSSAVDVQPGATPEATLQAYFRAMANHNADPQLAIYTPESRRMLAGHLMTPAQMDNLVSTYRRCAAQAAIVSPDQWRAVIRYPPTARACAPFFFQRRDDRWLLDLTMMQLAIRFDTANRWRFQPGVAHPYAFAFEDWRLDARGYPQVSGQTDPL